MFEDPSTAQQRHSKPRLGAIAQQKRPGTELELESRAKVPKEIRVRYQAPTLRQIQQIPSRIGE